MAKKNNQFRQVESTGMSLATMNAALQPYRTQTKAQRQVINEARKHGLIMAGESIKAQFGMTKMQEIGERAMQVGRETFTEIEAVRTQPGLSKPVQDYVDDFAEVLTEKMGQQIIGAALTGARNIGEAIERPIYFEDEEEERGFWGRLLGG